MSLKEAVQVKKIKVSNARAQLRITQIELARQADVGRSVVFNAEKGITISRISAFAILGALNKAREQQNLPALDFEDMDWEVQGED